MRDEFTADMHVLQTGGHFFLGYAHFRWLRESREKQYTFKLYNITTFGPLCKRWNIEIRAREQGETENSFS